MKKQLNVTAIANELRGNSAFFPRYKKEKEPVVPEPVSDHAPLSAPQGEPAPPQPVPPVRVVPSVPLVPPVRDVPRDVSPTKRIMKQRHPFDIYVDQYESLQQLALEERKQGGIGSMSAMVREALDELIARRRSAKK